MSTGRADRKRARRKFLGALMAVSLLICAGAGAETAEGLDMNLISPDMILAQDTVDYLHLTTPEGDRIEASGSKLPFCNNLTSVFSSPEARMLLALAMPKSLTLASQSAERRRLAGFTS